MRAILAAVLMAATLHPLITARAEPRVLADAELGRVAAGLFDTYLVMPVIVVDNRNTSTTTAVGSSNVSSTAISNVNVNNVIALSPTDTVTQLPAAGLTTTGHVPALAPPAAAPAQLPVWVPWAAELRPLLGLR